jgi:N-acetylmuramoyl-L-alanine amidase
VGGGLREADLNLRAAYEMVELFQTFGDWPTLTRWRDVPLALSARVGLEPRLRPDCFLSLHHNGFHDPKVRGFEVWTSPGVTRADALAADILDHVAAECPDLPQRRERGPTGPDKEARLAVLTQTRCPAVLLELEFLSSPEGRAWITDETNRRHLLLAIVRGVRGWSATEEVLR